MGAIISVLLLWCVALSLGYSLVARHGVVAMSVFGPVATAFVAGVLVEKLLADGERPAWAWPILAVVLVMCVGEIIDAIDP